MSRAVLIAMAFGLATSAMSGPALADDLAAKGEQVFAKNCLSCHALPSENKNAIGPSLHGVVGRHAGRASGYSYSSAMKDSGITWTAEHLDGYLTSPQKYVGPVGYAPHKYAKMKFPGLTDATERMAVIAFLKAN